MKINKKALSPRDFTTSIIFLFGFGIFIIFLTYIATQIITGFMIEFPTETSIQTIGQQFIDSYKLYDNIMVFLVFFLIIIIGITSYKLNTIKAFFVISFFLAGFYGLIAYLFSYIFGQIISDPLLLTASVLFPNTILICTNLHWISLAMIIVSTLMLYAKRDSDNLNTLT